MSIQIVGTSHVSQESIERIDEAFENLDPDIICLELDAQRLNSLLADEKSTDGMGLIHRGLAAFQNYIGSKTGVMPGEEMLYAFEKAGEEGVEVYLIDQDIRQTLGRLKAVRRKEKAKALAMLPLSLLGKGRFDYTSIPDQEDINDLIKVFENRFPELYQVFIEERNLHMAESLRIIQERNPEASIVAVVGAGHVKGLEEYIDEISGQSTVEETQQSTLEG